MANEPAAPPATTPTNRGAYQVIARRYRPQVFSQVIGQTAATTQLRNEIVEGRVGHGYLFCGPRGTGKTSMARIFAKALNCEHGPTPEPCGKCSACLEIAAGTHLDVIEVDAATYTKVENTRGLLEGLNRAPFSARKKVYIIDEVHMLSTHSFNALLKSLEEPPPNVVFVLATTNPEKIPETVISRCRRVVFERLKPEEITRSLGRILENEGVQLDAAERPAILGAIALAADGGLRDAQVLLDQLISISTGELKLEQVRGLLGVVESDLFDKMLAALVDRDTKTCLRLVADLVDRGRDLPRFAKMFLSYLRDVMILSAGGDGEMVRVADPQSAALRGLMERLPLPYLLNIMQQFLDLEERLRGAAPPRFLLEFALIKLTAIDPRLVIDPDLGGGPGAGARPATPARATTPPGRPAMAPRPGAAPPTVNRLAARQQMIAGNYSMHEAVPDDAPAAVLEEVPTTDGDRWSGMLAALAQQAPHLHSILRSARIDAVAESRIAIVLPPGERVSLGVLNRPENVQTVREALQRVWKRPLFPVYRADERAAQVVEAALPAAATEPLWPVEPVEPDDEAPAVRPAARVLDVPAPTPDPVQSLVTARGPFDKAMTLARAMDEHPALREAVELMEKAFGAGPVAFNGRPIPKRA